MEFEVEQSTFMTSPGLCIVCCREVNDTEDTFNEIPKSERLNVLSNVLRLSSQTIYQGLNITELLQEQLLYCSSCAETILNSLSILQEIKALEKRLTVFTNKLKQDLIQSYNERQRVEGNDSLYSTSDDVAINLIRKTFVQCWSDCKVQLPKLHTVEKHGRPIHPISDDDNKIIIVPNSVVSWHVEDDFSCLDNHHHNVSSESPGVPEIIKLDADENTVSNVNSRGRKRKPTHKTYHECEDESDGSVVGFFDPVSDDPDFEEDSTRKRKKKQTSSRAKRPKIERPKNVLEEHDEQNPTDDNNSSSVRRKNKRDQLRGVTLCCSLCEKTFQTPAALTTHVANIHEKTYKFFCHICGQGFQVNSMLQRHITYVHTTEKNFECDVCQKRFKRSHQLYYHKRIHTGERLICEICGRGFMQPEKLKSHLVIHTGTKTHPCPFCNKLFAIKQYVTNHIKDTHEGKRKGRNKKSTVRDGEIMNTESLETLEHTSPVTGSLLQNSEEAIPKPVAEVWRRQLNEQIGVTEIEITQESQQEARTGTTKFGENYVLKFISGM